MVFGKLSAWLLTNAGKKAAFYAASATSTGLMLAHFIPQTFLLDQYQKIIQYYRYVFQDYLSNSNVVLLYFRKGMTVPVSKKLQERFQKTLDLLEVKIILIVVISKYICYQFFINKTHCSHRLKYNFEMTSQKLLQKDFSKLLHLDNDLSI